MARQLLCGRRRDFRYSSESWERRAPGTRQEENINMTESNTFKISVAKTTIRYSFTRRKAKKWIFKGTVLRKAFSNFRVVTSKRVSNSSFCYASFLYSIFTIQK